MKNQLTQDLEILLSSNTFPKELIAKFKQKLEIGNLTKEEDPANHFCVFFAAYDSKAKQVFIGHHKKANIWLFNGGHVDMGESFHETLIREISEEWGVDINSLNIKAPEFLTISKIDSSIKLTCKTHYDIWYFIDVEKNTFQPSPEKLAEEFYCVEWLDIEQAKQLKTSEATLQGIDFIEKKYL